MARRRAIAFDWAILSSSSKSICDVVAVDSSLDSLNEGELGLLRSDEDHEGLQLGRIMLDASATP